MRFGIVLRFFLRPIKAHACDYDALMSVCKSENIAIKLRLTTIGNISKKKKKNQCREQFWFSIKIPYPGHFRNTDVNPSVFSSVAVEHLPSIFFYYVLT